MNSVNTFDVRNLIQTLKDRNIKDELLHFTLFLIDWKHTLVYGKQLTNAKWFKNENSIMDFSLDNKNLSDYLKEIKKDNLFPIVQPLSLIDVDRINLFINFIKEKTIRMLYTDFVNLYFSTYPVSFSNKNELIDLVECRDKYIDFVKETNNKKFSEIFCLQVDSKYLTKNDLDEYLDEKYSIKDFNDM